MISLEDHKEADELAVRIVQLFEHEDVPTEIAMQAMTRVMATCLCDQDDVLGKLKTMMANLIVLERAYRIQWRKQDEAVM
jgi:hypothetical protein